MGDHKFQPLCKSKSTSSIDINLPCVLSSELFTGTSE